MLRLLLILVLLVGPVFAAKADTDIWDNALRHERSDDALFADKAATRRRSISFEPAATLRDTSKAGGFEGLQRLAQRRQAIIFRLSGVAV
jgi:hypothetical protein